MTQHLDQEGLEPEKKAAIRKIRRLMDFWHISPVELRGQLKPAPPRPPAPAPVNKRYRHPVSGECWNGIGAQPDWLRHALLKEGYTVDELRPDRQGDSRGDEASDSRLASFDSPSG